MAASEHMCGKKWRKGPVSDCSSKNHGQGYKFQGGWRVGKDDTDGQHHKAAK